MQSVCLCDLDHPLSYLCAPTLCLYDPSLWVIIVMDASLSRFTSPFTPSSSSKVTWQPANLPEHFLSLTLQSLSDTITHSTLKWDTISILYMCAHSQRPQWSVYMYEWKNMTVNGLWGCSFWHQTRICSSHTRTCVNTRKLEIMGVIMSNFILRQQKHIFRHVIFFLFPFCQYSCASEYSNNCDHIKTITLSKNIFFAHIWHFKTFYSNLIIVKVIHMLGHVLLYSSSKTYLRLDRIPADLSVSTEGGRLSRLYA